MAAERLTQYTSENLQIFVAPQVPFSEPSPHNIGPGRRYAKEVIDKQREQRNNYNARLASLHLDDEDSQRLLFAQAISAVNGYPRERRERHPSFLPFAFLTEPNGPRFLIADLHGIWSGVDSFVLQTMIIIEVCNSVAQLQAAMDTILSLNPGVPKVTAESVSRRLESSEQASSPQ